MCVGRFHPHTCSPIPSRTHIGMDMTIYINCRVHLRIIIIHYYSLQDSRLGILVLTALLGTV